MKHLGASSYESATAHIIGLAIPAIPGRANNDPLRNFHRSVVHCTRTPSAIIAFSPLPVQKSVISSVNACGMDRSVVSSQQLSQVGILS
jgi:hypothetical protein